jgi:hypothetical protein
MALPLSCSLPLNSEDELLMTSARYRRDQEDFRASH